MRNIDAIERKVMRICAPRMCVDFAITSLSVIDMPGYSASSTEHLTLEDALDGVQPLYHGYFDTVDDAVNAIKASECYSPIASRIRLYDGNFGVTTV